ncbi:hypothetical protein CUMW_276590 [Citrus unshiu]|uniref:Ubiquitin-like protease family profile domain-containing protein n=1 Tax=Citrus unshiu TaxID=55188 RepID=A0A2H5N2R5_CITUN|nr:hypothetical protein CUMW_276590 [Citrus unshiu]
MEKKFSSLLNMGRGDRKQKRCLDDVAIQQDGNIGVIIVGSSNQSYGFMSYFKEQVKRLKASDENLIVSQELRKKLGDSYKSLPPDEKAKYTKPLNVSDYDAQTDTDGQLQTKMDKQILDTRCAPDRLRRQLCAWLVEQFVPDQHVLVLNNQHIKFNAKTFSDIMGVHDGGLSVSLPGQPENIATLRETFKCTGRGIAIKTLEDFIKQSDGSGNDFKVRMRTFEGVGLSAQVPVDMAELVEHSESKPIHHAPVKENIVSPPTVNPKTNDENPTIDDFFRDTVHPPLDVHNDLGDMISEDRNPIEVETFLNDDVVLSADGAPNEANVETNMEALNSDKSMHAPTANNLDGNITRYMKQPVFSSTSRSPYEFRSLKKPSRFQRSPFDMVSNRSVRPCYWAGLYVVTSPITESQLQVVNYFQLLVSTEHNVVSRTAMSSLKPTKWIHSDVISMYAEYRTMEELRNNPVGPRVWFLPVYFSNSILHSTYVNLAPFHRGSSWANQFMPNMETCEKLGQNSNLPQQSNGNDCGLYVMRYMDESPAVVDHTYKNSILHSTYVNLAPFHRGSSWANQFMPNMETCEKIFVPIHDGSSHWFVLVINIHSSSAQIWDSQVSSRRKHKITQSCLAVR